VPVGVRAAVAAVALLAVALAGGCSSGSGESAGTASSTSGSTRSSTPRGSGARVPLPPCSTAKHLVASDIDETLTVGDAELVRALREPGYEPRARPGAAAMMRDYTRRGYTIAYVTARPVSMSIGGVDAARATTEWLRSEGFPVGDGLGLVYLWPTDKYQDIRSYKAAVLDELESGGYELDYAYGNADTDAQAFADAGFARDRTFMIGKQAGFGGTVAVRDPGWVRHRATVVDRLPRVCRR